MPPRFTVRAPSAEDWRDVRDLRLRALADTPIAFGETLAGARRRTEAEWRVRAARGDRPHTTLLVAVAGDGTFVGTMGGYIEGPEDGDSGPILTGVFVDPAHRGRRSGVADALLEGVEGWAAAEGNTLTLHVHEDNDRAIAFYEHRGFVRTGRTLPYELAPGSRELELRKPV